MYHSASQFLDLSIIGCFYYTLANFHPKLRSTLKCIQILALVKYTLVQKYGMDEVLQHLIPDIKELENVSTFSVPTPHPNTNIINHMD